MFVIRFEGSGGDPKFFAESIYRRLVAAGSKLTVATVNEDGVEFNFADNAPTETEGKKQAIGSIG